MSQKLIKDPESFLTLLDEAIESVVEATLEKGFEEWKERNPAGVIPGSIFATCDRKAYYSYFHGEPEKLQLDIAGKKVLWLGVVHEKIVGDFLGSLPVDTIHIKQNDFPIHLSHPDFDDPVFSSTTDFVLEVRDGEETYYIPVEVKSTELYKWDEFSYHEYHLRQLLLWMHYAKCNNLNVPYGVLIYVRRSDYDTKRVIVSCDTKFLKIGRTVIDYDVYKPYLAEKIENLKKSISNKTLPEKPKDVPQYICRSCSFFDMCFVNYNNAYANKK